MESNGHGREMRGDLGEEQVGVSEVGEGLYAAKRIGRSFHEGEQRKLDAAISALEMDACWWKDSPHRGTSTPPSLEHSKTAPLNPNPSNNLIERHELTFLRPKTGKKETPKHDLIIDRLPENEKKKIIEKIVKIQNNGTLEVDVGQSTPVASQLLDLGSGEVPIDLEDFNMEINKSIPRLKIAILVVGTRGDVQPFLAMAKRLQEFGHHVRLATHANFRSFVKSTGIEFYPLGGDPHVLAGCKGS
ncbi:hypothetical protein ACLOJK_034627 [Asimina triloba]